MQCRKRQLHLGLDARDLRDTKTGRLPSAVVQEGRLADAGLPADDQDRALAAAHVLQQPVEHLALAGSAQQHRRGADGHRSASLQIRDWRPEEFTSRDHGIGDQGADQGLTGATGSRDDQASWRNQARETDTYMSVTTEKSAGATAISPFHIEVPQEEIDELRRRAQATRWPDRETVSDRSQGVQLAKLRPLVEYGAAATTGAGWMRRSTRCRSSSPRSTG